jgi:hypothetical protein
LARARDASVAVPAESRPRAAALAAMRMAPLRSKRDAATSTFASSA